jgi:spore germination protein YaaH
MTNAGAIDQKFSMSYIYFGNSSSYTSLVDGTQGSLNEVAPNYFTLDSNGGLAVTKAFDDEFVNDMHARGIRVVPYLSSDWTHPEYAAEALKKFEDPNNMNTIAESLCAFIDENDLDSVNIDLENLRIEQRANYVRLMQRLYEKLHPEGKTVAVAVAVKPNGHETGWAASYDYAGLAQYSDYLMLMAYDEHWDGGKPGSVASLSFVEQSVRYALTQVPKEKIVLGLPFYGRIWSDSGSYPNGYGVSNTRITRLIADYHGAVTFDSVSRSVRAVITVRSGDIKPVIGGTTLNAGTYTIWYENEQTLKERLDLIQKYDLKGAGSWSLGQEDEATWTYYKLRLNGCTFDDVADNWARGYILDAYLNGWVNGVSPESFLPDAPLTRAEAAAMLVRLLGYPVEAHDEFSFDDTKGCWAEDDISTARFHHIISGVGGNLFAPDCPVTRQELAVMLDNTLGAPTVNRTPLFCDVTPAGNPWSYDAIDALFECGVFTGFPDGSFRPYENVTRAEMAALMMRIQKA